MAPSPLTYCPQCRALMNRQWPACAVCKVPTPRACKDATTVVEETPLPDETVCAFETELAALLNEEPTPAANGTRSYRQWMTGNVPQTATIPLAKPLPPPKYHDAPSPCRTYIGRPCPKKACAGNRVRFQRTGMCTRCWERAAKRTTISHETSE
jgi:hypothetical protein